MSAAYLEAPSLKRFPEFLEAVRRSRALHKGLVKPPSNEEQFRAYLAKIRHPANIGHFVVAPGGELCGVINVNDIVLGSFRSGYLGYYAFVPFNGKGYMSEGLRLVLLRAFRRYGLHRVEANIQPHNTPSRRLVARFGFRLEGLSPRYLKIGGRFRDHERWALTKEEWFASKRRR